jgi:hypothetical protein
MHKINMIQAKHEIPVQIFLPILDQPFIYIMIDVLFGLQLVLSMFYIYVPKKKV